jgi:anti-anti-sigma factor
MMMDSQVKVIQASGSIDSISGNQLRRDVSDAIASGAKIILIDCEKATFMDSSGLGALVMILKTVREAGGRLALCSIIDQIEMILQLTSMDSLFEIFPNREAFEQKVAS